MFEKHFSSPRAAVSRLHPAEDGLFWGAVWDRLFLAELQQEVIEEDMVPITVCSRGQSSPNIWVNDFK